MPKVRTGGILVCAECGKEQYVSPREMARRKYCSRTCQSAAIARGKRRTCIRCGTSYEMAGDVMGKYCSRACYMAERQKRETCLVCAKPLLPHQILYCSWSCSGIGRLNLREKPCETCG